jgi:trans-2,3-dihydro-3-hydroxyanthranilate isomerase
VSAHRVATLDVFCDRPFAGNPLAVVEDADGLDDDSMQAVAREFGYSETVFLTRPTRDDCDIGVRIFTPSVELPFAGHPTVGTAVWLAATGHVGRDDGRGRVVLDERAGPVPVALRWGDGGRVSATFVAPAAPTVETAAVAVEHAASVLSLGPAEVAGPPSVISAGNPFLAVPLVDRASLSRAAVDRQMWQRHVVVEPGLGSILLFVTEGEIVYARVFGPGVGIVEDPATGSAAAAVTGLLAPGSTDGTHRWTIHQGDDMGRPSRIAIEADVVDGRAVEARVGGTAVVVVRGTMELGEELGPSADGSYAS